MCTPNTHSKILITALLIILTLELTNDINISVDKYFWHYYVRNASLVAQMVKNLPTMQKTWVWFLDWEDPLEKGKATHSSYSGLENSMDCIVQGVAKSRTWLNNFHWLTCKEYYSVQFSRSVMFDSLRPHGLQRARPPCPSPTPRVHSNSCPLSRWCHPAISSSVVPFSSCHQSFPSSGSFQMSQLFASGAKFQLQNQSFQWTPRTDLL